MAIRPTKGSGIGQVTGSSILPQNPSFEEQLSRIVQGQQPLPMNQGLGINLNPVPGAVGISQVPSTGLPNLDTAQSGVQRGALGLDMTAIDDNPFSISAPMPSDDLSRIGNFLGISPKGQESFSE